MDIRQTHTMEGETVDDRQSVLIVDRSEENREVLQTVLERRGVQTLAAGRTEIGLELARRHQPDLIVLDLEIDDAAGYTEQIMGPTGMFASEYRPRMVLLGNLRGWRKRLPQSEFMPKPYHYGCLIRKIEDLLAGGRKGDSPHLCKAPSGPFRQMGTVPFSPGKQEHGPCRRCSSSAEPIKAAALN